MKQLGKILTEKEMELVSLLMQDCENTGDIQEKLKRLFAGTIEQMLEAEMEAHLGYDKHSPLGNNRGNSRNGYISSAIMGRVKSRYRGTGMANLRQRCWKRGRPVQTKSSKKWRCTQKA